MSDLSKYIDESDKSVESFEQACEDMANVKFIMAERRISELLMIVAASAKLQAVVAAASKGFDFRATLAGSRLKTGKRFSLLPPVGRRELIAFAVNLLYAFDIRAIPLQEFLEEYYYSSNGINFSFSLFVHSIIIPLKDSVVAELREAEGKADPSPAAPLLASPSAEDEERLTLPTEAVNDIIERIADVCDIAEAESTFTEAEKKELFSVATGLAESVKNRDAKLIRTLMTGFGGVIRAGRLADRLKEKAEELDETLRHFGV